MMLNEYDGEQGELRREEKRGWTRKTLDRDMLFIHGGPMGPSEVRRNGLDAVRYGAEWVVDGDGAPIGGGKLLFSFLVVAGNQPPPNYTKPGAVGRLWGNEGHCYIFLAPNGTTFYSAGAGAPAHGMEIAFPYRVQSADVRYYCSPSRRHHHLVPGTTRRSGALTFNMVPWNVVVAAQTPAI